MSLSPHDPTDQHTSTIPPPQRITQHHIHSFRQFAFLPEYLTEYLDALFQNGPSPIQIQALLLLSGGEDVLQDDVRDSGRDDGMVMQESDTTSESVQDKSTDTPQKYTIPHGNYFNTSTAILMESKSGTGKTLAYLLTALFGTQRRINEDANAISLDDDILILVPTNELVWQVKREISRLLKPCLERNMIHVHVIEKRKEENDSTAKAEPNNEPSTESSSTTSSSQPPPRRIFLSTPQRWLNALDAKTIPHLENVAVFVMDEADALMGDQIKEQVKRCWSRLFKCRKRNKRERARVLAFSATFEKWVIADMVHARIIYKDDSFFESVIPLFDRSVKGIKEYYTVINQQETRSQTLILKERILIALLQQVKFHQCIVFCNRKARCAAVARFLKHNNVPGVLDLAGGAKPEAREETLTKFVSFEHAPILVATDVAARGLDVTTVDLIINMDVPHEAPTYMHRVGRAGRFERMGAAVTIVADTQEGLFEYVRRLSSNEIELLPPLENLSSLNQFMHTQLSDEEMRTSWEKFREELENVLQGEIEYLEDADEDAPKATWQNAGVPREYQFDFDLPFTDESDSSFKIGHIQVFLPKIAREDPVALGDMEALEEDESVHPFALLRPYELAMRAPQQLSEEPNAVVFTECAKICREFATKAPTAKVPNDPMMMDE